MTMTIAKQISQGMRQGDPLAFLLFANAIQSVYAEVVLRIGLQAGALHDDLTLVGKPDALIDSVPVIKELAAKLNVHSGCNQQKITIHSLSQQTKSIQH